MGKRCIYVKIAIEIFRRNLCVCHVGEKLQRKCVKFIKKMNMTSNNLLFCNVLVGAFLKLTVHMFVCHVTLHFQQLTLEKHVMYHIKEGKVRDGANFEGTE